MPKGRRRYSRKLFAKLGSDFTLSEHMARLLESYSADINARIAAGEVRPWSRVTKRKRQGQHRLEIAPPGTDATYGLSAGSTMALQLVCLAGLGWRDAHRRAGLSDRSARQWREQFEANTSQFEAAVRKVRDNADAFLRAREAEREAGVRASQDRIYSHGVTGSRI